MWTKTEKQQQLKKKLWKRAHDWTILHWMRVCMCLWKCWRTKRRKQPKNFVDYIALITSENIGGDALTQQSVFCRRPKKSLRLAANFRGCTVCDALFFHKMYAGVRRNSRQFLRLNAVWVLFPLDGGGCPLFHNNTFTLSRIAVSVRHLAFDTVACTAHSAILAYRLQIKWKIIFVEIRFVVAAWFAWLCSQYAFTVCLTLYCLLLLISVQVF